MDFKQVPVGDQVKMENVDSDTCLYRVKKEEVGGRTPWQTTGSKWLLAGFSEPWEEPGCQPLEGYFMFS
jgi:hypothetical protein